MNGQRLKALRKALKLSQVELGEALKINASAISQMETNRIRPSLDTLYALSKNYDANLHWLITGEGVMFCGKKNQHLDPAKTKLYQLQQLVNDQLRQITQVQHSMEDGDIIDLPVTGEIAAGPPIETSGEVLETVGIRRSLFHGIEDDFMCLRVNGRSMEPDIKHGDVIIVRASNDWNSLSGKICAVRVDGSITLKTMNLDYAKQLIFLLSINEAFQPIVIDPTEHQDITLLGYMFILFRKVQ